VTTVTNTQAVLGKQQNCARNLKKLLGILKLLQKSTGWLKKGIKLINNGNRTEWSPIQSVIIRVINKIGRPRSGSPIC